MSTNQANNYEALPVQVTPEVQVVAHARLAEAAAAEQNLIKVVIDTLGTPTPEATTPVMNAVETPSTVIAQNAPITHEGTSATTDQVPTYQSVANPSDNFNNIIDLEQRRASAQLSPNTDLDESTIQRDVDAAYRDAA